MKPLKLALFFVIPFLIALADSSMEATDISKTAISIPNVEIADHDEKLFMNSDGILLHNELPFSGFLIKKNSDGVLIEKIGYLNGSQAGDMLGFYENGAKKFIRPYLNGEKHGIHLGWYEDGTLRFLYQFENGLSEGNHKEWYEDGSIMQDFNFKDGKPFGSQKVWRKDGKIRGNYVVRENGRRYGLMGIKRCTKIDGEDERLDPYVGEIL
jgi:antitoxin component YwqK of YwqJK toxin-antitoxin module